MRQKSLWAVNTHGTCWVPASPYFWTFDNKSHLLNIQQNSFSMSLNGNFIPSVVQAKTLGLSLIFSLTPHLQLENPVCWTLTYSKVQHPLTTYALSSFAWTIVIAFYLPSLLLRTVRGRWQSWVVTGVQLVQHQAMPLAPMCV